MLPSHSKADRYERRALIFGGLNALERIFFAFFPMLMECAIIPCAYR